MKKSAFLSLNWLDLGKGLVMAILTPIMAVITQSLESGSFVFDWKTIGLSAAAGGFAYLVKNFFTKPQVQAMKGGAVLPNKGL
jgi:hypothetical protein